ncbi:MAG: AAA family ATPase [Acidobacteriota bacterium]
MNIFDLCPRPESDWRVDWQAADQRYSWIRALRDCPQNPRYHGEGDVWVHTRMVCEAMAWDDEWRSLPRELRQDLFAAALLHDAAKPACTKVQKNGRVTSRGHARRGALHARRVLWLEGVDSVRRERICALVRHHMVPLYLRDSENRFRQVRTISQSIRCDHLAILGRADAEGRICEDPSDLHARHDAYAEICREQSCFDRPYGFSSEHGRFLYLRHLSDDPAERVEPAGPEVILTSGLPGADLRRLIDEHFPDRPILDIDALRGTMGVSWRDNQGAVIAAARDRAREWLGRGESFVWFDMNLSRQLRDHHIGLLAEHDARVRIVYREVTPTVVGRALARRGMAAEALDLLLDRWAVPDPDEAHQVHHWPSFGESGEQPVKPPAGPVEAFQEAGSASIAKSSSL